MNADERRYENEGGAIRVHPRSSAVAFASLERKLAGAWRKEQAFVLTSGLSVLLAWIGGLALGALVIDRSLDLPGYARLLLLALCLAASLAAAWKHWRGLRRHDPVRTALRVEDRHRELNSVLVSAVEFSRTPPDPGTSESLRRNVVSRAAANTLAVPFGDFVRTEGLKKGLAALGAVAVLYVGLTALKPALMRAFVVRMLNPFAEAAYPTRTRLEFKTGDAVVKEGDSVTLAAWAGGHVPERGTVHIKTGEARAVAVDVEREPRPSDAPPPGAEPPDAAYDFRHTCVEVYQDFSYWFRVGDARSETRAVSVIPPPRITRARVEVRPAAYTGRPRSESGTLTVRAPEGAAVRWTLDLDRPVAEGTLLLEGADPVRMDVRAGGTVVEARTVAHASRAYHFRWVEREHGFTYEGGRHFVQVTPDREPRVSLLYPKEDQKATLRKRLTVKLRARDDHGIAAAALKYVVNEGKEKALPLDAEGGARSLDTTVETALKKLVPALKEGDIVAYAAEVADAYPGKNGRHVSRSEARRVQVLSEKDYLAYVARRRLSTLRLLRSAYRQERMASGKVESLRRRTGSGTLVGRQVSQEALLEATRQALVRQRLNRLVKALDELERDVRSNGLLDAKAEAGYEALKARIRKVERGPVSGAAAALRLAADGDANLNESLGAAAAQADKAAREIGSLMVRLGVDFATEVFAGELHEVVMKEEGLRLATAALVEAGTGGEALWPRQGELADWLTRLLRELKDVDDYEANALAVVRLSRVVGMLREAQVEERLHAAGQDIRRKAFEGAVEKQTRALVSLLEAEFRIRHGAELEALLRTRKAYARVLSDHETLRKGASGSDEARLAAGRAKMQLRERKLARATRLTIVPPELAESASTTQYAVTDTPVQRVDVGEAAGAAVKAMEALEEVPMISLMAEVPDQANILLQALMLATEQRKLRFRTRASPPQLIALFAAPQTALQRRAADLVWEADGSTLIGEAETEMGAAAKFLGLRVRPDAARPSVGPRRSRTQAARPSVGPRRSRTQAVRHQQLAEKALRRYILEVALQMFQMEEEFMEPSGMPSIPSPLPVVMTMESLHMFTKTAVEGELVKGGRSEWRVLGKRERAALNENFARELPSSTAPS